MTTMMCQVEGCGEFVDKTDLEEVVLFADDPELRETIRVYRCSKCVECNYSTPEMGKSEQERLWELEEERIEYNSFIKKTQGFDPSDYCHV
ncbi:hypothetical protein [Vibrio campbellii]|uniref:hypothetical protein n=1 Tax=Vibrio campbellii TaxID=680 RepID=UPI004057C2E0